MNTHDRQEVAEYLDNESANCSDAEFGMKLAQLAGEQYAQARKQGIGEGAWFGETGFAPGHPSQLMADIAQAFEEVTSDVSIVLDAAWTKDLSLVNEEWRELQARNLEQEAERIALLLRNACIVLRTLEFKEDSTNPFKPLDDALDAARKEQG